jgi:hypothetical protein
MLIYCNACSIVRGLPTTVKKVESYCEICGQLTACNTLHSTCVSERFFGTEL